MNKNDLEGAISDYTKAIEVQPNDYENYYNRGVARLTKGDNDGAIEDFSRAIEMSPQFPLAYNNRGNARKAKGRRRWRHRGL